MIKEIENAMISHLKAEIPTLKTVRGYNGDFDVTEEEIRTLITLFPAALIIYNGADFDRSGDRREKGMTYAVILADKSLRGDIDKTMRHGLYDLLETVCGKLDGEDLNLDITPLQIVRERILFHSGVFSVYAQEYETDINEY